jgi:hypothetical protein
MTKRHNVQRNFLIVKRRQANAPKNQLTHKQCISKQFRELFPNMLLSMTLNKKMERNNLKLSGL